MKHFTTAQRAALRTLSALWSRLEWSLIGASALACHLDMRWRRTADLDLVIAVDQAAFPAGLDMQEGWMRRERNEHEWHGPGGVRVDLIPAGPGLLAAGCITWETGHRMSLVGMRHALSAAVSTDVGDGVIIRVPPLHVLALLKMISYTDRPAERERDLADLGYALEEYVDVDDDRRYSEDVPADLEFEARPAFLLGRDLCPLLNATERAAVERFVSLAIGEGGDATNSRLLRLGPPRWRSGDHGERLKAVIRAFKAGLA